MRVKHAGADLPVIDIGPGPRAFAGHVPAVVRPLEVVDAIRRSIANYEGCR